MRPAALLGVAVVLLAAPAVAETAQEQAAAVMYDDTLAEGFPAAIAETVAQCFASRMTDAEAQAFLDAETLEAQQNAAAAMVDYAQAVLCVAEVLG